MSMTHDFASELLAPYVDGALPLAEAAGLGAHLAECAACSAEVRGLEELNRAVVLPPAPPVSFHAFWAGIEKRLPRRGATRSRRAVRRSLALAVALAALLLVATAASAFASDRILPDSPLYSLKLVGETVRIDLTLAQHDRLQLKVQLAAERLQEARTMAGERKNQLAVASLRRFQSLLAEAGPGLRHPAPAEREQTLKEIDGLSQSLTEVEQTDPEVQAIVQESEASLTQDEQDAGQNTQSSEAQPSPAPEASGTPGPGAD